MPCCIHLITQDKEPPERLFQGGPASPYINGSEKNRGIVIFHVINQQVSVSGSAISPFHLLPVRIHPSLNLRDRIRLFRRLEQVVETAFTVFHICHTRSADSRSHQPLPDDGNVSCNICPFFPSWSLARLSTPPRHPPLSLQ